MILRVAIYTVGLLCFAFGILVIGGGPPPEPRNLITAILVAPVFGVGLYLYWDLTMARARENARKRRMAKKDERAKDKTS